MTSDEIQEIEKLYNEDNNKEISRISAEIEEEFYCKYTRVEEIMEFAKRLKMNKIGIAACVGLMEESRTFAKILFEKEERSNFSLPERKVTKEAGNPAA